MNTRDLLLDTLLTALESGDGPAEIAEELLRRGWVNAYLNIPAQVAEHMAATAGDTADPAGWMRQWAAEHVELTDAQQATRYVPDDWTCHPAPALSRIEAVSAMLYTGDNVDAVRKMFPAGDVVNVMSVGLVFVRDGTATVCRPGEVLHLPTADLYDQTPEVSTLAEFRARYQAHPANGEDVKVD